MENEQTELCGANVAMPTTLKHFQHDYYELAAMITEPEKLKPLVITLYKKYVEDKINLIPIDEELENDNNRQRDFLEKSVAGLCCQLHKEMEAHHANHLHIMHDNVALIKKLNELKRELKTMKMNVHNGLVQGKFTSRGSPSHRGSKKTIMNVGEGMGSYSISQQMEIESMRNRIVSLEVELNNKEECIKCYEKMIQELEIVQMRPKSRGELLPMYPTIYQDDKKEGTMQTKPSPSHYSIKKVVQVLTPNELEQSSTSNITSSKFQPQYYSPIFMDEDCSSQREEDHSVYDQEQVHNVVQQIFRRVSKVYET